MYKNMHDREEERKIKAEDALRLKSIELVKKQNGHPTAINLFDQLYDIMGVFPCGQAVSVNRGLGCMLERCDKVQHKRWAVEINRDCMFIKLQKVIDQGQI